MTLHTAHCNQCQRIVRVTPLGVFSFHKAKRGGRPCVASGDRVPRKR